MERHTYILIFLKFQLAKCYTNEKDQKAKRGKPKNEPINNEKIILHIVSHFLAS